MKILYNRSVFKDLQEFIQLLEKKGELKRIQVEVDPVLEISEIYDRTVKAGGPALLFENVRGSNVPLLINAFGSKTRMELALGIKSIFEIEKRLNGLLKIKPPQSFKEAVGMMGTLKQVFKFPPKKVKKGISQEVVSVCAKGADYDQTVPDPSFLDALPIIQCWPDDAGKFITLGQIITKHPETNIQNVGMYRLQKFDGQTLGFHVHIHHEGANHYHQWKKLGKKMPVAVALGGDPALIYSATAPLPPNVDEYIFAGFLRNKNVTVVKAKTQDLWVPADAEIIIEGFVDPDEPLRMEGPFGDHTGYYSLADYYPVLHITAITHRKNPIYPTTVVGRPVQEDCYLGWATERIFLPLLQMMVPELVQMHLPFWGIFHNAVFVTIDKRFPYQAQKVMQAIWGMGQMTFSKMIFVFDHTVDIFNLESVLNVMEQHCRPALDIVFSEGALDVLDHSSDRAIFGSKIGFDCTPALPEEGVFKKEWLELPALGKIGLQLNQWGFNIEDLWLHPGRMLVVSIKKTSSQRIQRIAAKKYWNTTSNIF
jgi:4-hydroxy-3-polyprenylbenzoate decarboxylase